MSDNWDYAWDFNTSHDHICFPHPRCYPDSNVYRSGIEAYRRFLASTNPVSFPQFDDHGREVLYYTFDYGDSSFFVLDCRGLRDSSSIYAFDPSKTMLGPTQLARLKRWLIEANSTRVFKFIVTTVPFTGFISPDLEKLGLDGWSVFAIERENILLFIKQNNLHNVVFLSGDIHYPYVVELREGLFEFQNSPIGSFGPFNDHSLKTPGVDKNLERIDHSVFGWYPSPLSYAVIVDVDTNIRPASLTVSYFKGNDQINARYSRKFVEGVDLA